MFAPLAADFSFYGQLAALSGAPVNGSGHSILGQLIWLMIEACAGILLHSFWLNQAMTEKIYSDFCLVIRRANADQETNLAPIANGLRIS